MLNRLRKMLPIFVLSVLPCLAGCGTSWINVNKMMGTKLEQESIDNPVLQLIPVWQEAEGPGVKNQGISRGFGGQIYFITENRGLPSEVKGGLRVYLFDDKGTVEEQQKPIYQFDFEPEAWQQHSIMTKLGPAYTLFIPYPRPGRDLVNCALRVRYTPPNGQVVFSQMATLTLPGAKREGQSDDKSEIKLPAPSDSPTVKSSTISLTDRPKRGKIAQVGGDDIHTSDVQSPAKSGLQTASFESDMNDAGIRQRVRPADHQEEAEIRRNHVVDQESPFGDPLPEEPSVRTYSIQLD